MTAASRGVAATEPPGLAALAEAAATLVPETGRAVLGIAGAPGAGKSTLAAALVAQLAQARGTDWVAHVPMDGFHLADVQLERLNALRRKGAPDTFDDVGYACLVERVRDEQDSSVYAPGFDRILEQPVAAAVVVPPSARLVVTEGNYLLLESRAWPRARAAMAEVWFVIGDDALRVERLVARHVEFGKAPDEARAWVAASDERNAHLVDPTSRRADRVVVNAETGWRFASPPGAASG